MTRSIRSPTQPSTRAVSSPPMRATYPSGQAPRASAAELGERLRWLDVIGRDARDELTPAVDVDLVEDGLQVVLHGVRRDEEPVGDLLGREALKNELCDIPFAPRQ